jgi:hypothetical protein
MATATKLVRAQGDREWLGLRDLTAYAAVSERTLRSWLHRAVNPLPAVQVAGKILVRRSQFDAWLEQHRIQAMAAVDVDGIVKELMGTTG